MNRALLIALLFFVCRADAQVVQQWVNDYDNYNDTDRVKDMVVDRDGNVYVTGSSWSGSIEEENYVTIKYNTHGVELWRQEYDNYNGPDIARAIALDSAGNVYVTGSSYDGTIDELDYVTIKYSSTGVQQWIAEYDNYSGNDEAFAITVSPSGKVWVTGSSYDGSIDEDDMVTICYSTTGTLQWLQEYDTYSGPDTAFAIVSDDADNVYITGCGYDGSIDEMDMTTIKYSPTGVQLWFDEYDNYNGNDKGEDIVVDSTGAVFVTGSSWSGSIDEENYVTIKYSPTGTQAWLAEFDLYSGPDRPHAIALDRYGFVYVTGQAYDGISDKLDYTTIKYSPNGTQLWMRDYNNYNGDDIAWDIVCDSSSNVYITGQSYNGITNKDDIATICYNSQGTQQWIREYNHYNGYDGASTIQLDQRGSVYVAGWCYAGITDDQNYITIKYCAPVMATVAQDTLYMCNGGNDSVQLSGAGGISCVWSPATHLSDPYSFSPMASPLVTTLYTITVFDTAGCLGTATVKVIVSPTNFQSRDVWICQGNSYMFPDSTIAYSDTINLTTLTNMYGCDSIIYTTLHVDTVPVDTSVTVNGATLIANDTTAFYYLWLNCDNGGQVIPNQYGQSYIPAANGNYAVVILRSPGCRDTSACINIISLDNADQPFNAQQLSVYPNPTNGSFTIDFGATVGESTISINDASGRLIYAAVANNQRTFDVAVDLPAGVYLVTAKADQQTFYQKLIVE